MILFIVHLGQKVGVFAVLLRDASRYRGKGVTVGDAHVELTAGIGLNRRRISLFGVSTDTGDIAHFSKAVGCCLVSFGDIQPGPEEIHKVVRLPPEVSIFQMEATNTSPGSSLLRWHFGMAGNRHHSNHGIEAHLPWMSWVGDRREHPWGHGARAP
eukprot:s220_g31.t1